MTHHPSRSIPAQALGACLAIIAAAVTVLADDSKITVTQLTQGPQHHFFGYIGQSRTIPWSADGRYVLALQVGFQDRLPGPDDPADVCLIDVRNGGAVRVLDQSRGWNPQQGTMFYWNPQQPATQFFFNDRDRQTGKVFTVLFDLSADGGKGRRLREYRFEDSPVANGGVAQGGGFFTAINYARMARLRPVTGYAGAWDWTAGVAAPADDGVFRVEVDSGARKLLVSFAQLREAIRPFTKRADERHLFINHTLHNRTGDRIYFYCRGDFENPPPDGRVNTPFTMRPDGGELTAHETFIGGHPDWEWGDRIIGSRDRQQVVYDVREKRVVEVLGDRTVFPHPEGDIAFSPDGRWLVNSHREGEYHHYTFFEVKTRRIVKSPPVYLAKWTGGPLRLDPAPAWNRISDAIVVPGIAPDGTRQMFVLALQER
jgi:hypothetical protein